MRVTDVPLQIVVPVRDEAENFGNFWGGIESCVKTAFRLVVVYADERDTTLSVIPTDNRILLQRNEGKGVLGALKTGLASPTARAVVVTMVDGSDDPRQIDEMFKRFEATNASIVAASRYTEGGHQAGGPMIKGLLSKVAGKSLRMMTGLSTSDPTNNFKLYSQEFLRRVQIESEAGFELALELTVKAHILGLRIEELPTTWRDRTLGKSKFKLMKWLPHYFRWYLHAL